MKDQAIQNQAGKARLASVSVHEALAYDPMRVDHDFNDPKTWDILDAEDYKKNIHGDMEFYCPCCFEEEGELVRLKRPSKEFYQTILSQRFKIPPRYTLWKDEKHGCSLERNQVAVSHLVKGFEGVVDSHHGTKILNLNIPAGQESPQSLPFSNLKGKAENNFNRASEAETKEPRKRKSPAKPSDPHSTGVNTVERLAEVMDATEFDKTERDSILLRIGPQMMPLGDIYHEKNADMYRDLLLKEKARLARIKGNVGNDTNINQVAIFQFQPNCHHKFWKHSKDGTPYIPSLSKKVTGKEGRIFYVTTRLRFETPSSYEAFKKALRSIEETKDKKFLVYSEHAHVDYIKCQEIINRIDKYGEKRGNVYIKASVFSNQQFTQWKPPSPQMRLFDNDLNILPDIAPEEDSDLAL